jgi:predicted nucleotide-binding protein (sugar kinase/HSP70/actin superfamily)
MTLEILPCIVETVNYQVVTYESLRGKGEEAKARKNDLIKAGIEEKYIKDFAEDVESAERAICGNEERLSVYLEILDIIGK